MFNFLKHITVEPSYLIYITVYEWMRGFDTNLYLQKTCRFNQTTEPDLSTECDDEKRGILFITELNTTYTFTTFFLCAVVSIFGSSWGDFAGQRRRPLIFMTILGQIFQTLSGCLNSYFWQWTPTAAAIPWVVFEGFSGGIILINFTSYAYLCDICDFESRTMRLGFLGAVRLIGLIAGDGGSGFLLRRFGFYYCYLISFVVSVSGLIIGIILIKDTSVHVEKKIGVRYLLKLKGLLFNSFRVVFNKNLGRKRIAVTMLLIVNVAAQFTFFGELSVSYQYLRYQFGFNEEEYSYFLFFKLSGSALGILFCSVVLSKRFNVHDGLIGILAGIFDIIAIVALMFANQVWQIYFIPLIDIFHGTALTVCNSFVSKYYNANESGRLYAVNSVLSLMLPFAYSTYNIIYQNTLDSFPSAFCVLSLILDILIVLCYWGSYFCSKKFDKEKPKDVEEELCGMIVPT